MSSVERQLCKANTPFGMFQVVRGLWKGTDVLNLLSEGQERKIKLKIRKIETCSQMGAVLVATSTLAVVLFLLQTAYRAAASVLPLGSTGA